MWSSGPAGQGQFSGNAWREQVITRHPSREKRLTVAWPMPRLAPVSSRVLRSGMARLRGRVQRQVASARAAFKGAPLPEGLRARRRQGGIGRATGNRVGENRVGKGRGLG